MKYVIATCYTKSELWNPQHAQNEIVPRHGYYSSEYIMLLVYCKSGFLSILHGFMDKIIQTTYVLGTILSLLCFRKLFPDDLFRLSQPYFPPSP